VQDVEARIRPFVLGAFGKQRRTLNVSLEVNPLDNGLTTTGTFCDPLLGIKGGVEFLVTPRFVIAPAIGVAINLDESDRTSYFTEGEFNYLFEGGGFVGAGIGLWDFTADNDNSTGSLLVHFGVPIAATARTRYLFAFESRLFFDEMDDIENNYQVWAGVRIVFR
jgi:hypothetical protein